MSSAYSKPLTTRKAEAEHVVAARHQSARRRKPALRAAGGHRHGQAAGQQHGGVEPCRTRCRSRARARDERLRDAWIR